MGQSRDGEGTPKLFPDVLRAAIAVHGETQRAASRRFGVTPQYVSEWLAGRRVPGPKLTAAVARYCGISVDELRALSAPTYRETLLHVEDELTAEIARLRRTLSTIARRVESIERRLDDR